MKRRKFLKAFPFVLVSVFIPWHLKSNPKKRASGRIKSVFLDGVEYPVKGASSIDIKGQVVYDSKSMLNIIKSQAEKRNILVSQTDGSIYFKKAK